MTLNNIPQNNSKRPQPLKLKPAEMRLAPDQVPRLHGRDAVVAGAHVARQDQQILEHGGREGLRVDRLPRYRGRGLVGTGDGACGGGEGERVARGVVWFFGVAVEVV